MELISANPDIFDIIRAWAVANPFDFFWMGTIGLMILCYFTKDWI